MAGARVLAQLEPAPAGATSVTIDPASRPRSRRSSRRRRDRGGGPANGEVLGLAGMAVSKLQPPGSTMKVITITAALEEGATG